MFGNHWVFHRHTKVKVINLKMSSLLTLAHKCAQINKFSNCIAIKILQKHIHFANCIGNSHKWILPIRLNWRPKKTIQSSTQCDGLIFLSIKSYFVLCSFSYFFFCISPHIGYQSIAIGLHKQG